MSVFPSEKTLSPNIKLLLLLGLSQTLVESLGIRLLKRMGTKLTCLLNHNNDLSVLTLNKLFFFQ